MTKNLAQTSIKWREIWVRYSDLLRFLSAPTFLWSHWIYIRQWCSFSGPQTKSGLCGHVIWPIGLPMVQKFGYGAVVTGLIALKSRAMTINAATTPLTPIFQTYEELCRLDDTTLHAGTWGHSHSQIQSVELGNYEGSDCGWIWCTGSGHSQIWYVWSGQHVGLLFCWI